MSEQFPTPQELEPLGGQVDYVPQDERFGPLSARPDGKLANAHTFLRNVNDNMALSATWQSADWLHEQLMPSEDGFNPFDDERVKAGKVKGRYFDAIAGTRSKAQMDHLLSRIDTNETMRARLEEEGGAWSALVAGVLDPTNAIGGPAMMGRGLLVGAFRGAAMGGAQTGFGEVVGPALDPTRDFQLENIVNGALIGGALGGVAGTIGSKTVT